MSKINPWTWIISGLLLALCILCFGFFFHYKPNSTSAALINESADAYKMEGDKMKKAKDRVKHATELLQAQDEQWATVLDSKAVSSSRETGGIDLGESRYQLVVDARRFRNDIQSLVNGRMHRGGVKVIQGPLVPTFSTSASNIVESDFNYPALGYPVLSYDFGQVVVEGTFDQIAEHVESWTDIPNFIAVTDGLTINGTSPKLRATYNLSMVGFIRGTVVHPPVPDSAVENQGGQGGGNGGGGFPQQGAPPTGSGGAPSAPLKAGQTGT